MAVDQSLPSLSHRLDIPLNLNGVANREETYTYAHLRGNTEAHQLNRLPIKPLAHTYMS